MDEDHVAVAIPATSAVSQRMMLFCYVLLGLLLTAGTVRAQVTEDQRLTGTGGGIEAEFGDAVALVETEVEALALVGAPGDAERGFNAGAVYAYRYDETAEEWVEEAKLWPKEVGENSFVGFSVALAAGGSLAFVAGLEPGAKASPLYGRVYVFRREDQTWVEEVTLAASDETPRNAFGCSLAISADNAVAVVGACQQDAVRGAVYVFRRDEDNGAWVEEAKLTTERLCFFNAFGSAVAVSAAGDRVVTTEPCGEGGDPSALYFFHRAGAPSDPNGGWVREARLDSYGGGAVALSEGGDIALSGFLFGSVVAVLERNGEMWTTTGEFAPNDSGSRTFGQSSIILRGSTALIGDDFADGQGKLSGAAYLFQRDMSGEWREQAKLTSSTSDEFDMFGYSVALTEHFALVGASREGESGAFTGAAYAYDLARVVATEPEDTAADALALSAYPNPFLSDLTLSYVLSQPSRVRLAIYDVLGREIATLTDAYRAAGEHRTRFSAEPLPAGLYIVRLEAGGHHIARRLVLLK